MAVILTALGALLAGCGQAPIGVAPKVTAPAVAAPRVALGAGVRNVDLIVEPNDGVRVIT